MSTPTHISPSTEAEDRVREAIRRKIQERLAGARAVNEEKVEVVDSAPAPSPVLTFLPHQQSAIALLGKRGWPAGQLDFAVDVLKNEDIPAEIAAFIPKLDPTYKVQHEQAIDILRAWQSKDKVLITGPTGAGKSSLIKQLCAMTNRPYIRINMTGDVESSTIFGTLLVEDGATVWKDGPATEAWKFGAVLNVDEWELMPPEISFGFQWMLEDEGRLFLKEKPGTAADKLIDAHPNALLVFSGNTLGQGDDTGSFAGTNVQNTAFLDRFQTVVHLDYLSVAHEVAVIKAKAPSIDDAVAQNMVKFAGLVRQARASNSINLTMSPRTLINWGRKIATHGGVRGALRISFLNKLRTSDAKVVNELYSKVFGATR